MGASCSLDVYVRNSKNEVVQSRLFNDLLIHLEDRGLAKDFYGVGTDSKFLDMVRDKAKFDENGEITFNSLRKLAKIDVKKEKILASLNKEIDSGVADYNDAILKISSFNRSSDFKDDYIATITPVNDKYEVTVVPRTKNEEAKLEQIIQKRSLRDRIMYRLNSAGVSVKFIEEDDKVNGRYSTENVERTAEGLHQLIRVARGEKLTQTLAEEAGHFAVGSLGDSPLVQRLTELLYNTDNRKAVYGEAYNSTVGNESAREAAGHLVGKAIMDEVDKDSFLGKLAHRVVTLAKKIYATFKGDSVLRAKLEAKDIARSIARDFMSEESTGNIEEALKIRETLYSAEYTTNITAYKEVINELDSAVRRLKAICSDSLWHKTKIILQSAESGKHYYINNNPGDVMADNIALDSIAEVVSNILDMVGPDKEIPTMLQSIDFSDAESFYNNMAENGRKLRQVRAFVKSASEIARVIETQLSVLAGTNALTGNVTNIEITDRFGNIESINIKDVLGKLTQTLHAVTTDLQKAEKNFFIRFCEDVMGSKSVMFGAKVIWNITGKNRQMNPEGKTRLVRLEEAKEVNLSTLIDYLDEDISFFDRFLASMSNNSDVIGQVYDRAVKKAHQGADNLTNNLWDRLRLLEYKFKKLGISTEDLLEKDEDGNFTGNILSELNWGAWEKKFEENKYEKIKEFKESNPNWPHMSETERAVALSNHLKLWYKSWHKANSEYSELLGRYIPKSKIDENSGIEEFSYRDYTIDNLMDDTEGLKPLYNEYVSIKRELDSLLPGGCTSPVRLPQFKGTFINVAKNNGGVVSGSIQALRSKWVDTFYESSEDTLFGGDHTYNSEEEEIFANQLAHEKENINRLPIFGVNKLKDMKELSTDIFGSMLAYGSMAYTYAALDQVVHTLEVGQEVLKNRKVGGNTRDKDAPITSKANSRIVKFMDKQVYSIGSSKTLLGGDTKNKDERSAVKVTRRLVLEKIMAAITSFGSKYFLGGNVAGGMVNAMTGFNEIFKEALSGEYFTVSDFHKANTYYFTHLFQNYADPGSELKSNKLSLFIRHFNVLGNNKEKYRQWNTDSGRRALNLLGNAWFLPYKTGEHYMQSMSYLSLAYNTKVYNSEGEEYSLFDAYDNVDNEEGGNVNGKTLKLKEDFFKNREDIATYEIINSIINKIQLVNQDVLGVNSDFNFTQEEQDYLDSKGYSVDTHEEDKVKHRNNIIKHLQMDAKNLKWNVDDESLFMDKAREISNRLHGIYNSQDKTAFHQMWYGNAVLSMKGYALGMLERRFSGAHYSTVLGQEVEGSLNTAAKVLAAGAGLGYGKAIFAIIWPFGEKKALTEFGFSKHQLHNLRRNFGDYILIFTFLLLRGLTALPEDEEEEEFDKLGIIHYFANRLYKEQAAFNFPNRFYAEAETLGEVLPIGLSAVIDIVNLNIKFFGAPLADEENSTFYYQENKEGIYEKYDPKWINKAKGKTPYVRSWGVFKNPYYATDSYDWGTNINR